MSTLASALGVDSRGGGPRPRVTEEGKNGRNVPSVVPLVVRIRCLVTLREDTWGLHGHLSTNCIAKKMQTGLRVG